MLQLFILNLDVLIYIVAAFNVTAFKSLLRCIHNLRFLLSMSLYARAVWFDASFDAAVHLIRRWRSYPLQMTLGLEKLEPVNNIKLFVDMSVLQVSNFWVKSPV